MLTDTRLARPVLLDAPADAVLRVEEGAGGGRGWTVRFDAWPIAVISSRHVLAPVEVETAHGRFAYRPRWMRRSSVVREQATRRPWARLREPVTLDDAGYLEILAGSRRGSLHLDDGWLWFEDVDDAPILRASRTEVELLVPSSQVRELETIIGVVVAVAALNRARTSR